MRVFKDGIEDGVRFVDEDGVTFGTKRFNNKQVVVGIPHSEIIATEIDTEHLPLRRFGHNPDVGTTEETLWHPGGVLTYLSAAEQLQIVSSNVNDDGSPVGTGARTVFIQGLDTDYILINETITMNGTTNVTTSNSYLRILKMRVIAFGSTGNNVGTISAKNNAASATFMTIEPKEGESNQATFTTPAGCCAYIKTFTMAENSGKGSEISLWVRDIGNAGPWLKKRMFPIIDSPFQFEFTIAYKISEKTDIELRAVAGLAGANVVGDFTGWRDV